MALYPFAEWRPLAAGDPGSRLAAHDVVCLHTMAGFLTGTEAMFRDKGWAGTESHFGIGGPADLDKDGVIYQWVDTDFQADANLQGNARLISIETSDGGNETTPWSQAQLDAIIALVLWCCREYSIPAELIPDSAQGRRGIGYHRQGIDPWRVTNGEKWSNATGKVCPGQVRITQLIDNIIPRVQQELSGRPTPTPAVLQLWSISPDSGMAGAQVELSGSGFTMATGVAFGPVWADSWSTTGDQHITAIVPEPITSGSVWVTVNSQDATSAAVAFSYDQSPSFPSLSLTSVSPDTTAAGSQVVLSGSGFTSATGVAFGDVPANSWWIDDDTQVTATVPAPLTSGSVWVTVSKVDAATEAVLFTYET
ncbi:IPT/TIG domain-containing protein [Arthrobacter pascens]|uniref:IPT/TIG domain-containing protein n=1 Tax=Arthrobacter pascens TaxID=1677 RepID=UPI00196AFC21|nr:IPT/TIG domain-containing protein [Arthrobacter pascens]MBN3496387.1 N-acetylmuramoyl-L-alanine amidase [Arthrobacter pascens]